MRRLQFLVMSCLLMAYVGVALRPLWIHVGFVLNQRQLAAEFCVNQARPEMHCDGRCYLRTKLIELQTGSIAEKPHVGFAYANWEALPHPLVQDAPAFHAPLSLKNPPLRDDFPASFFMCRTEFPPPEPHPAALALV